MPRLYPTIRPGARYYASLRLLESVKRKAPHIFTKSGVMVGLGEQRLEVHQVMDDMRSAGVDFLTMGQYLQPTPRHAKVEEFVTPQAFDAYAAIARAKGFLLVAASPLTRSSYHAGDDFKKMQAARAGAAGALERLMPRHSETKHLPYTPEQLFDLVADVARYDEFLPWVVAVRVRSSSETETVADLVVGFNAFKERFTSRVVKERPAGSASIMSKGRSNISTTNGRFDRAADGGTERPFLGRFRVQVAAVRNPRRRDVRPRAAAHDRRPSSSAPRRFTASAGRARKAPPEAARPSAVFSSKNFWSATILAGSASRSARAKTTVPTGFDGVPPPGPAMPVIATATSASDAASAPRAIAQAVATLTAPNVSTTSSLTLSSCDLGGVRIGHVAGFEHRPRSRGSRSARR